MCSDALLSRGAFSAASNSPGASTVSSNNDAAVAAGSAGAAAATVAASGAELFDDSTPTSPSPKSPNKVPEAVSCGAGAAEGDGASSPNMPPLLPAPGASSPNKPPPPPRCPPASPNSPPPALAAHAKAHHPHTTQQEGTKRGKKQNNKTMQPHTHELRTASVRCEARCTSPRSPHRAAVCPHD